MEVLEIIKKLEILYQTYGLPLVFISSFIEITPLGFAIPGSLMLAVGGYFSYGKANLLIGIIFFAFLGTLLTFISAYLLGVKTGNWLIKKLHQEENAAKAKHLLNKHGGVILTTSMLSSYIRFWIAYVAGIQKYNFFRFLFYAASASLTWVSLYVIVGYIAGAKRESLESKLAITGALGYVFLIVSTLIIGWSIKREFRAFKKDANNEDS